MPAQPVELPATGTSLRRWSALLAEHAQHPDVVQHADDWRRVVATPAALPAVQPDVDTYATAGHLSAELDAEATHMLLTAVPAAFHAGTQDILLIALAIAVKEFLNDQGDRDRRIGIDIEGHGRQEELSAAVDLSRTVGWFTTKYPVALDVTGLSWAQVAAGDAALGAAVKDAKEQLRSLPDGITYGLLRYLNPDVELAGADPTIGFNYFGRLGGSGVEIAGDSWGLSHESLTMTGAAAAVPTPLMHTLDLSAVAIDSDAGPRLHANWTWARSALDHTQIDRLSQLWFDVLAGICAHVQAGGGG